MHQHSHDNRLVVVNLAQVTSWQILTHTGLLIGAALALPHSVDDLAKHDGGLREL